MCSLFQQFLEVMMLIFDDFRYNKHSQTNSADKAVKKGISTTRRTRSASSSSTHSTTPVSDQVGPLSASSPTQTTLNCRTRSASGSSSHSTTATSRKRSASGRVNHSVTLNKQPKLVKKSNTKSKKQTAPKNSLKKARKTKQGKQDNVLPKPGTSGLNPGKQTKKTGSTKNHLIIELGEGSYSRRKSLRSNSQVSLVQGLPYYSEKRRHSQPGEKTHIDSIDPVTTIKVELKLAAGKIESNPGNLNTSKDSHSRQAESVDRPAKKTRIDSTIQQPDKKTNSRKASRKNAPGLNSLRRNTRGKKTGSCASARFVLIY